MRNFKAVFPPVVLASLCARRATAAGAAGGAGVSGARVPCEARRAPRPRERSVGGRARAPQTAPAAGHTLTDSKGGAGEGGGKGQWEQH